MIRSAGFATLLCLLLVLSEPHASTRRDSPLSAHTISTQSFGGHVMNGAPPSDWPPIPHGSIRTWDARGLQWPDIEPHPGEYHWDTLDRFVAVAGQKYLQIVYTFGRVPQWAALQPQAKCAYGPGQCSPPRLDAFGRFVRAIATRYHARISVWELWNEPDFPDFFSGNLDQLVQTVRVADSEIFHVQATATVLSPAPAGPDGFHWMARFLERGGRGAFNVLAFHCYPKGNLYGLLALVDGYKETLKSADLAKMPLWCTEGSWGDAKDHFSSRFGGDAAYLTKFHLVLFASGVDRVFWYAWNNAKWGTLVTGTGESTAAKAYRTVRSWLAESQLGPCRIQGSAWTCAFYDAAGEGEIVWSDAAAPTPVLLKQSRTCVNPLGEQQRSAAQIAPESMPWLCH